MHASFVYFTYICRARSSSLFLRHILRLASAYQNQRHRQGGSKTRPNTMPVAGGYDDRWARHLRTTYGEHQSCTQRERWVETRLYIRRASYHWTWRAMQWTAGYGGADRRRSGRERATRRTDIRGVGSARRAATGTDRLEHLFIGLCTVNERAQRGTPTAGIKCQHTV